jgi:DNA-binding beta-propeller fold protein YncE
LLATVPATQYFDKLGEGASGEFNYQITAIGLDGKEGARSKGKSVKILILEPPKELIGRAIGKSVGLRWKTAEGVVAYNVYRAEGKDAQSLYKLISSVTTDTFTDSEVAVGKKYFYKVSARDASGKESRMTAAFPIKLEVQKIAKKEEKILIRRTRTLRELKNGLDFESGVRVDLRAPYDVAVGVDRVFVSANGPQRVVVFDKKSFRYLFEFGPGGKVESGDHGGSFRRVTGLCLHPDGDRLYVVEADARSIHVFTLDGVPVVVIKPEPPRPPEKPFRFFNLEVDKEGNVWLPDGKHHKIRIYDVRGKELRTFGKEGEVNRPGFIRIDWKGKRFYAINNHGNHLGISVFDLEGKFQKRFGEKGVTGGKFWAPVGIDVMDDGSVIQADGINSIINVFDPETGTLRYHLRNEDGKDIVQIGSARGLQVEGEKVYVVSSILNEVEILEIFGEPFSE